MSTADPIERKAGLATGIITNSRFNYGTTRLKELLAAHLARKASDCRIDQVLTIQGLSGSGKTTLLAEFVKAHTAASGTEHPIVRFTLAPNCTPKQLVVSFASALDDPLVFRSTLPDTARRVCDIVADRDISMVCIDEVQHLFGKTKPVLNYDAADTLKVLVSELKVPFVLVGLPELQGIIDGNTQLGRRGCGRVCLDPFNIADPGDFREWRSILQKLDQTLPFERSSRLHDRVLAQALHKATGGMIGGVAQLIRRAGEMAIDENAPCIAAHHLQAARDELASTEESKRANPFETVMDQLDAA